MRYAAQVLATLKREATLSFGVEEKTKTAGVGFAVSNRLSHINPIPISDRIMTARVELKNNSYLALISVYGPTMQRPEFDKRKVL